MGHFQGVLWKHFPRADSIAERGVLSKSLGRCTRDLAAKAEAARRRGQRQMLGIWALECSWFRASIFTQGPSFLIAPLDLSVLDSVMGCQQSPPS